MKKIKTLKLVFNNFILLIVSIALLIIGIYVAINTNEINDIKNRLKYVEMK